MLTNDNKPPTRETVADFVRRAMARATGLDADAITEDLETAIDLGLDSIKALEVFAELAAFVPDGPALTAQAIRENEGQDGVTIGWLVDLAFSQFESASSNAASAPEPAGARPPEVAVIDEKAQLPLPTGQFPFFAAHWAVSTCSLCSWVEVRGPLTAPLLAEAMRRVAVSHPSLRSSIHIPSDAKRMNEYEMRVAPYPKCSVACVDLSRLSDAEQKQALDKLVEQSINHEWDLSDGEPWSLSLLELGGDRRIVVFQNHHLVSDGLSNQIVMRELLDACRAVHAGEEMGLDAPEVTVSRYADSVRSLNQAIKDVAEKAPAPPKPPHAIGRFMRRSAGDRANVRCERRVLSKEATRRLHEARSQLRATTCGMLVTSYTAALSRRQPECPAVGLHVPTSGREFSAADNRALVGCFAQSVTLDVPCQGDVVERLGKTQAQLEHLVGSGMDAAVTSRAAHYLANGLQLEGGRPSATGAAVLRSGMGTNLYLSYIGDTGLRRAYGAFEVLEYGAHTTTNPGAIDTLVEEFHGRLVLCAHYDANAFGQEEVASLMDDVASEIEDLSRQRCGDREPAAVQTRGVFVPRDSLDRELAALLRRPLDASELTADLETELGLDSLTRVRLARKLSQSVPGLDPEWVLQCRTAAEMLGKTEGTSTAVAASDRIPLDGVYASAVDHAARCAVRVGGREWTYREFDAWTNQLARGLGEAGYGKGALVGVLAGPSVDLVAALVAIIKAGAAYVPLDPKYPNERLRETVQVAELTAVIVGEGIEPGRPEEILDRPMLFAASETARKSHPGASLAWTVLPTERPTHRPAPEDLMTVLFTSGSTGKPKGVMLHHAGYENRLQWMQRAFPIEPGDRVAFKTSCAFDVSIWEWLWPLMKGATVDVAPAEVRANPWGLIRWMREEGIAVMHFVPSLFREFVASLAPLDAFPSLRWLIFSGEALPVSVVRAWMLRFGKSVGLVNLYGPTEASIDVTSHVIEEIPPEDAGGVPIGKAIDNVIACVLDPDMRPVPDGEQGQLYLGGVQLALGYLRNPEETQKRFRPDPSDPARILYATGDLARRHPDGTLDYLGRIDNQLKIRGNRVELGEIEAKLDAIPGVNGCAVLARQNDGQVRLEAHLVLSRGAKDVARVRDTLSSQLPSYMVPQVWQLHESLPVNHNGKLDRKALLAIPQKQPTGKEDDLAGSAKPGVPLLPTQRWIVEVFGPDAAWRGYSRFTYNAVLDPKAMRAAVRGLFQRHAALKTRFIRAGNELRQVSSNELTADPLTIEDLGQLTQEQQVKAIDDFVERTLASLTVESWPLLHVGVFRLEEARYEFAVVGHHMIADMVTNQLLFRDLWASYVAHVEGREPPALDGTHPTLDEFRATVEQILAEPGSKESIAAFWNEMFQDPKASTLPSFVNQEIENLEGATTQLERELSRDSLRALKKACRTQGWKLHDAISGALYHSLACVMDAASPAVSHRVHGRIVGGKSFMGTAGNFAANFPLAVRGVAKSSPRTTVERFREVFAEVPWSGPAFDAVADSLNPGLYPDMRVAPVRLNLLPEAPAGQQGVFHFEPEHADQRYADPEQPRTAEVECFARTRDGALALTFDFARGRWPEEWVSQLADAMQDSLRALCADQGEKVAPVVPLGAPGNSPSRKGVETSEAGAKSGDLHGKVAIVTGGGRGIGRAIAHELGRRGASLVVAARSEDQLRKVVEELRADGIRCLACQTDVTSPVDAQNAVQQALTEWGRLDILVNNAGRTACVSVQDCTQGEFREVVETNLFGTYHMSKAAIPSLTESRGCVVNIGSDSSEIGYPLFAAYAASKHAVLGFTKSLAEELKPVGVRVNAVCPAMVATDMAPAGMRSEAMTPESVAQVVGFLASQDASMITGESIRVFGRQDMYWYGSKQAEKLAKVSRLRRMAEGTAVALGDAE